MNKKTIALILTALVIGGALFFFLDKPEVDGEEVVGKNMEEVENNKEEPTDTDFMAADFTLENLDGEEVSLSDYRGKIVFLNFWATWCGFCDEEMPDLEKINNENDDVVVLAVNVREDREIVEDYIKEGGYTFPVLLDETGEIGMDYVIGGLPTTYFIGSDGKLLDGMSGMMNLEQMESVLEAIREFESEE